MHESKGQDAAAEPRGARDQLSGLEVHRIGRQGDETRLIAS